MMSDYLRMPFRYDETRKLKLIQLYREEPCLWNRERHPRILRDDAYKRILSAMAAEVGKDELPLTIDNIKTKIKNLRTKYHQELRKMTMKTNYEPKSAWFLSLKEFISDYIIYKGDNNKGENSEEEDKDFVILEQPKKRLCVRLTRVKHLKPSLIDDDKTKTKRPKLNIKNEEKSVVPDQSLSLDQDTSCIPAERILSPVLFSESSSSVKRHMDGQSMPRLLPFSVLPQQEKPSQRTVCLPEKKPYAREHLNSVTMDRDRTRILVQSEDEFHYFGLSVSAQLRSMPLADAMLIQSRFQHILSTERRKINENAVGDIQFSDT